MRKIPPTNPVDWQQFGQFLFTTRESDPGYTILNGLRVLGYDQPQLFRFVVGWVCYYNLGLAAQASELKSRHFYTFLRDAYPTATRASERRHFRGAAGLAAIDSWQRKFPQPEDLVEHVFEHSGETINMGDIRKNCESVAQMGDYFMWKWGDLYEVLWQKPCDFRGWENKSPKVPQQGAELIANEHGWVDYDTQRVYRTITRYMRETDIASHYSRSFREFDVQDAETICCVYKQYRSGSYVPGIRTAKAYARLAADGGDCETAQDAIAVLLRRQPVKDFRKPPILARILNGELIYKVEDFLCR